MDHDGILRPPAADVSADLTYKVARLAGRLSGLGRVAVAFSGGADSTLLLAAALRALGRRAVLAVTADSPTLPRAELREARELAEELGAEHVVITTRELDDPAFAENSPDRCFHCKRGLFDAMRGVAAERGIPHLLYGATAADLGDHRPGMRAAAEAGAIAPLLEVGFSKEDVRRLSRAWGLRTWDKPAMACLSSRVPYGRRITADTLARVEAAERLLREELGLRQVRVRDAGDTARIELPPEDLAAVVGEPARARVVEGLKAVGYTYVTLDLQGFRSGSMNEVLAALGASPATDTGEAT